MKWLEPQIETRMRLDAEMTERAYAQLAISVSEPNNIPILSFNDLEHVDGAIQACLNYYNVLPGAVPSGTKDIEERMDWMCRPSGTMHRNVRLNKDWYKYSFGAMLGKMQTGEAVALIPRGLSGYYFVEPESGKKIKVTPATAKSIESEAVLFYKPLPARKLTMRDFMAFLFRVFNRHDYLLAVLAVLAVTLIGLIPPQANKIAFGTVVPSNDDSLVLPLGALLLGVAISTALIGASRNLVMSRVSLKLDVVTEAATFARLMQLPTSFFKNYASGDLSSRVTSMTMLAQKIVLLIMGSALSAIMSLLYIVQISAYTPALAMPALGIIVGQAALTVLVTFITARYEKLTLEKSAELSGTVTALLGGVQKIKLAGAEDRAFAKWAHGYAEYARVAYNRPTLLRALPAFVALVGLFGNIILYYLAGSTHVTIDNYMAFNVAYGQVNAAIMELANVAGEIAQVNPMISMVAPILEAQPEVAEDKPSVESLNGGIEVSGVSFRYNEDSPYVLDNLSFKVRPGEYLAIVGKSGCGKSTIVRLLLGFEKPERGTIFYGPHDAQKVDLRSLRRHIGVVTQNGKLFMGDLQSNITISAPSATVDDAWEAAELAGIADDIRQMPMGMQTLVTEGSGGVSGGQRQRLMIARAICGKRRVLIFDEATSALDNVTQRKVSESLDSLDCTRIVVAHRLSTVRHCDRILVLDNGTIAEDGTYEELMQKNGLFAELVARQKLDS